MNKEQCTGTVKDAWPKVLENLKNYLEGNRK